MVNIGLDISEIIFEKGVEVHREKSGWLSTYNCAEPVTCEPSQIFEGYRLRPIVLTVKSTPSISHRFLAPASKGRLLEIEWSELTQIAPFQNTSFLMLKVFPEPVGGLMQWTSMSSDSIASLTVSGTHSCCSLSR